MEDQLIADDPSYFSNLFPDYQPDLNFEDDTWTDFVAEDLGVTDDTAYTAWWDPDSWYVAQMSDTPPATPTPPTETQEQQNVQTVTTQRASTFPLALVAGLGLAFVLMGRRR